MDESAAERADEWAAERAADAAERAARQEGWPGRLRAAREAMFPTTWRAAKALQRLDPQHLPGVQELHRYWAQRWEAGKYRPNRSYRELIEALLKAPGLFDGTYEPNGNGTQPSQPAQPAAPALPTSRPTRPAVPVRPAHPARFGEAAHPGVSGPWTQTASPFSVINRESGLRGGLSGVIAMTADDAAKDAADLSGGHAERTLEQLHDDVLHTARDYPRRPLPEVFLDAKRIREFAVELAGRTRRPDQLADLNTIAGQSCGLLSVAAFDMGYWDAAARFAGSALSYGELARHNSLRAWAMGMQAFMANWQGRSEDAVDLIAAALEFAPPGTATARLHAHTARSRALLGDRDGTDRAAREAGEARVVKSHDEMHDTIGGEFDYNLARQEVSFGTSYIALGDGASAERHAQRALDLYAALPADQRFCYDEHAARVDLASARILRGDLAGARAALTPVFSLPPIQRAAGITSRLDQVCALLAADLFRNSREATQLTTDITDFTADTTARALPESDL